MYCINEKREDLSEILANVKDIDEQIFSVIIQIFRKENISDSLEYLQQENNQIHFKQFIFQLENLLSVDKDRRLNVVKNNIKIIINILKQIRDHNFNQNDYSTEIYLQTRQSLKEKIKEDQRIIKFLQFLVQRIFLFIFQTYLKIIIRHIITCHLQTKQHNLLQVNLHMFFIVVGVIFLWFNKNQRFQEVICLPHSNQGIIISDLFQLNHLQANLTKKFLIFPYTLN
ncbi:unnamed protein product [Paramecium pentaurelia]|uniref:Transmembrane protein n=1 Tax=Paramecium pentaurelia TaxID=43138 RepID=A0A8S1YHX2_9CILI|nr:unnamed protein product [Paramecium pentaurelia]